MTAVPPLPTGFSRSLVLAALLVVVAGAKGGDGAIEEEPAGAIAAVTGGYSVNIGLSDSVPTG